MNRIILIGNGFDLAHEMRTSYQHFIDDYWKNATSVIRNVHHNRPFENEEFKIQNSPGGFLSENNYKSLMESLQNFKTNIDYKNKFLKIITEKSFIDKWVDVENEYYSLLIKSFDKARFPRNDYDVKELNTDFEKIKAKLGEYLKFIENEFDKSLGTNYLRTKNIIGHKIYHPFKLKDFSETSLNQKAELEYNLIKKDIEALANDQITMDELNETKKRLIQRIDIKNPLSEIKKLLQSDSAINYFDLIPDQILFLNFNYTFTDKIYSNPREFDQFNDKKYSSVKSIRIHGTVEERDNNPIIFGFGDELDDDYKRIEKLNNNDYLQNIKSINYLETDNYKKLLEYINSGNYQIFIFGHSCGVSDRTLLNTMFEHDNCASIKVFYHQKNEKDDNYSDIVRNISRNFNDKAKMRDRVVNKKYCEPLK